MKTIINIMEAARRYHYEAANLYWEAEWFRIPENIEAAMLKEARRASTTAHAYARILRRAIGKFEFFVASEHDAKPRW